MAWEKVLYSYNIPIEFIKISKFFLKPNFSKTPMLQDFLINKKYFEYLDFLLWKWKSPLSREWYPYLLGLKHDLQILNNDLTRERIIKTQTKSLANFIINKGI